MLRQFRLSRAVITRPLRMPLNPIIAAMKHARRQGDRAAFDVSAFRFARWLRWQRRLHKHAAQDEFKAARFDVTDRPMTRAELFDYCRRTGQMRLFFQTYPKP